MSLLQRFINEGCPICFHDGFDWKTSLVGVEHDDEGIAFVFSCQFCKMDYRLTVEPDEVGQLKMTLEEEE